MASSTKQTAIRITGFGGQGVVLAGHIIGRACAIEGGQHATMIQSFGPEARGSTCSATLMVSESEILYPYIDRPDIFVTMSTEGYEKYRPTLKPDSMLVYERDLVHPELSDGRKAYGIPSTRIAESLGRTIVQNIVMTGFFAGVAGLVQAEAMRQAVAAAVPPGTEALNLRAFDEGLKFARELLAEAGSPAAAARLQEVAP